jgi:coatomer subunit beta'
MTLEGHAKGIGALAFCAFTDKPYLASGSDDMKVIVWDYTSKQIIFTFKGHENNLSALCFHPELPILISAAEDTSCKFWNINTGKLETERIFGYDVIWDINAKEDDNMIGFGCDEATLVIQIGNQEPLATFNASQAKIIYAQ